MKPAEISSAALAAPQCSGSRLSGKSSTVKLACEKNRGPAASASRRRSGVPVSTTVETVVSPRGQFNQCAAAADLDVVGVSTQAEHLEQAGRRCQGDHVLTISYSSTTLRQTSEKATQVIARASPRARKQARAAACLSGRCPTGA